MSSEFISFASWRFYSLQKGLTCGLLLCLHREGTLCSPCEGAIRIHVISGSVFMVPPEPSPLLHLPLSQPWGPGTWSCFIVKFTHHFLSTHIRNWDSPHACSLARRLRVHEAQLPGLSPGLTGAEFKPPSYHFLSFSLFSKYVPMGWHIFLLAADSQPPVNLLSQSDGHPKCS